jgi:transposase
LLEFTNPLNQWEKQELIIKLRKEGKTYREIAHIAGVSLRDIKPTLRKYERKLQTKKGEENNQKIKKLSKKRCRAYDLFRNRKNPVEVAIDLELDYEQVRKYWTEFLRLNNMTKLYNIYIQNELHLDYLFKIYYFMLRNEIPIKDCENVLHVADETAKLYQIHSNLKAEIEKLKQMKNNMHYSQYNHLAPLKPLPKPPYWNYQYTNNLL